MRKTILTLALAASGLAAAAAAAQTDPAPPPPGPRGGAMMRADADHDGVVTRAEAIAEADQRFAMMDTDRDGKLTSAERSAARDRMRAAMMARRGEDAPPPGADGARPMGGMGAGWGRRDDPDGDGTVSRADYEASALRRFDRMDANHDGRVDQAEIAARAGMRRGDAPPPPPGE